MSPRDRNASSPEFPQFFTNLSKKLAEAEANYQSLHQRGLSFGRAPPKRILLSQMGRNSSAPADDRKNSLFKKEHLAKAKKTGNDNIRMAHRNKEAANLKSSTANNDIENNNSSSISLKSLKP